MPAAPRFAQCDALVAGAGPAGAATAAHLAHAGLRVLLLDRQKFPRDKVCGDFVGPIALRELARLGVTSQPGFQSANPIRRAALYLDGEELIRQPLPKIDRLPGLGKVIPRVALDQWIVEAARESGAELWEGVRVVGFQTGTRWTTVLAEGPDGRKIIRARVLVGADGSVSSIARLLRGAHVPAEDRVIAVRAYVEGVEGPTDLADLYFNNDCFPGYSWLFPSGNGMANLGAGILLKTLPSAPGHLRDILARGLLRDRALRRRLGKGARIGKMIGWPLVTYNPRLAVTGSRCVLVGDAAGLINPVNGEGIQQALQSARWASETIIPCAAKGDFSANALAAYAGRVERELRFDMAVCGWVVEAIRNRILNPLWFEFLRAIAVRAHTDPGFAEIAGGVLAGMMPAKTALWMVQPTTTDTLLSAAFRAAEHWRRGPGHFLETCALGLRGLRRMGTEAARNRFEMLSWLSALNARTEELVEQVNQYKWRNRERGDM